MVLTQKSRPASTVPDRGPVLRKSKRAVPARCAQVLRSDASRPGQVLPSRHPGNLLARIPTFPTQKEQERRSRIRALRDDTKKMGQTPFIQETSSVVRPPSVEKIMKSGRSVPRPSSRIMDPSFERALKAEKPSCVLRPRSWTRPWRAEERLFIPELGALFIVPTLRVQGRLSLPVILAIS